MGDRGSRAPDYCNVPANKYLFGVVGALPRLCDARLCREHVAPCAAVEDGRVLGSVLCHGAVQLLLDARPVALLVVVGGGQRVHGRKAGGRGRKKSEKHAKEKTKTKATPGPPRCSRECEKRTPAWYAMQARHTHRSPPRPRLGFCGGVHVAEELREGWHNFKVKVILHGPRLTALAPDCLGAIRHCGPRDEIGAALPADVPLAAAAAMAISLQAAPTSCSSLLMARCWRRPASMSACSRAGASSPSSCGDKEAGARRVGAGGLETQAGRASGGRAPSGR